MGLTPFPYITQSLGVWSPRPHSQLQFNWSQQEWGAGMFFLLKHCPWWWNYSTALGQVSQQRWNSNLWHFEHSFVFPAEMLLASFRISHSSNLIFFLIWNKPCSKREWSGGNCSDNQGMLLNVSARSMFCLKFSFSISRWSVYFFCPHVFHMNFS